jgi:hypothetical protein
LFFFFFFPLGQKKEEVKQVLGVGGEGAAGSLPLFPPPYLLL